MAWFCENVLIKFWERIVDTKGFVRRNRISLYSVEVHIIVRNNNIECNGALRRLLLPIALLMLLIANGNSLADRGDDAFNFATGLLINRDYRAALDEYDDFLKNHPGHARTPEAMFRRGECLYRLERQAEAIEALAAYERANPRGETGRFTRPEIRKSRRNSAGKPPPSAQMNPDRQSMTSITPKSPRIRAI